MSERTGLVTLKSNPVTLEGDGVKVGQQAPDFTAVATDMSEQTLWQYRGRPVVLCSVPSLDTPVCDVEGQRFNKEAAGLGQDAVVLLVSMDTPPALKRWCGQNSADRIITLSDFKHWSFAKNWGLRIRELGLLARAVYVIDREGTIQYEQIVPEVAQEPDYDEALSAVKQVL